MCRPLSNPKTVVWSISGGNSPSKSCQPMVTEAPRAMETWPRASKVDVMVEGIGSRQGGPDRRGKCQEDRRLHGLLKKLLDSKRRARSTCRATHDGTNGTA